MDWKKIILFVFLLLVGIILFGFPPLSVSLFQPLFFITYIETTSPNTLSPLEKDTYSLFIRAPNETHTFFVKLIIIDQQSPELAYAEKQFLVNVR